MGNTVCSNKYEPICVTDFKCVFEVKNQCILDQMNCGCGKYKKIFLFLIF